MGTNKIYDAIFSEDDIKWQSIIYELIRNKKVDPWDIDLSKFSEEYLSTISKLKSLNFRISGKVVFAAALMLKIKTNHLGLDDFILLTNEEDEIPVEDFEYDEDQYIDPDEAKIMDLARHIRHNTKKKYLIEPRTVRPRQRKVTVVELMSALKKAIEVDKRRERRRVRIEKVITPEEIFVSKKDLLTDRIKTVNSKLLDLFRENKAKILFEKLLDKGDETDRVQNFLPVLHLANTGKLNIHQEKPFDKIYLEVLNGRN